MAKRKKVKTPEEIADDNSRTIPMGLFNYAEAYRQAAQDLAKLKRRGGFTDTPIRTLYAHGIELYLKALLKQHYSVDDLKDKFGHSIRKLRAKAEKHGLTITKEDRKTLAKLKDNVLLRLRYIRTGPAWYPEVKELEATSNNLRDAVAKVLREAGIPVRT